MMRARARNMRRAAVTTMAFCAGCQPATARRPCPTRNTATATATAASVFPRNRVRIVTGLAARSHARDDSSRRVATSERIHSAWLAAVQVARPLEIFEDTILRVLVAGNRK